MKMCKKEKMRKNIPSAICFMTFGSIFTRPLRNGLKMSKIALFVPRRHPSSKINKTEMIRKHFLSLFLFMTFCPISTTTAATAVLVYSD
jgi:hypothetical protein